MDKKQLRTIHDAFLDRLKTAVSRKLGIPDSRGIQTALKKALGLKNITTVNRWFKSSFPSVEYLIKIHEIFGLTPNFLLGIENKQIAFPIPVLNFQELLSIKQTEGLKKEDFVPVPLVSGTIAAGEPIIAEEAIEDWAILHKNIVGKRKHLISIRIDANGMSMYPILSPGDIVVIDTDDKIITPKGIYAVRIDRACTVKRVQHVGNQLLLIPENKDPQYETQIIDLRLHPQPIIGRVIWCGRAL